MSQSTNHQSCAGFNFLALLQGGIGDDVWDKEQPIFAADFRDAANQAASIADEVGGQVVSLERNDYPQPEWRCFNCNAVFSDNAKARQHCGDMKFDKGAVVWDETACQRLKRFEDALNRLARLGNEPHLGNSIGNEIAREALKGDAT